MPGISIGGGSGGSLSYTSNDAVAVASAVVQQINTDLSNGFTSFNYTGSGNPAVAPEPPSGSGGIVTFAQPSAYSSSNVPISVFVDGADQVIIDTANGPLSVQGGAAGGTFLGGAGLAGAPRNVTYTNITPSGNLTDTIVILGGNNLVQTATFGTGNYNVQTGNGNDTVNVLLGNASINAGTGYNQINVGTGTNQIYSEGYDLITGSSVAGGADTVSIGSGQTTVNSAFSTFTINDISPNPLSVTLGFGIDTVNTSGAGSVTLSGVYSAASVTGAGGLIAYDRVGGDTYSIVGGFGALNATVVAGSGNELIGGASDAGSLLFQAGSGNDTLVAGAGLSTLTGAVGGGASALLISGSGATTFSFTNGQSGGADVISGFNANDTIALSGYGSNPQGSAVTTSAGTIITLADGTTINIVGAAPAAGQYRIS